MKLFYSNVLYLSRYQIKTRVIYTVWYIFLVPPYTARYYADYCKDRETMNYAPIYD